MVNRGNPSTADLLGPPGAGTVADSPPVSVAPAQPRSPGGVGGGAADEGPLPLLSLTLIGIITLGGLLIRLRSFNDSLFGDEISTYYIVVGHSLGRVLRLVESNQETSPPLYFIVAWATKGWLGSAAQSIRLVSLVTGTAAIPLTFLLGLWTVGRRAAMVGAACVALSPYMIFYSTEARPFMLMMFFVLLSTLALLRALDTGHRGWWIAYAVSTCGAVYTHYTAVFLLVVQLAWALWTKPRARRALVVANVVAALGFIPWINGFREDLVAPNFISALLPVNLHDVATILETDWIGHPETTIDRMPGELAVALAIAGIVVAVVGLVAKARGTDPKQWRMSSRTLLIVLLAVGPAVLVILYSLTRADIFGGPFLIASWPGLALAIGILVVSPPKLFRLAAVVLTLLAFGIGGVKMLGSSARRPNIGAVTAYINRSGVRGDPIVSLSFFANPLSELDVALADAGQSKDHPVLRLGSPTLSDQVAHLSGPKPRPVFFGLRELPARDVAAQAVKLAKHGTIFFVSYRTSLFPNHADAEATEFLNDLPARFRVVAHATYPGFSGDFIEQVDVIRDTDRTG